MEKIRKQIRINKNYHLFTKSESNKVVDCSKIKDMVKVEDENKADEKIKTISPVTQTDFEPEKGNQ